MTPRGIFCPVAGLNLPHAPCPIDSQARQVEQDHLPLNRERTKAVYLNMAEGVIRWTGTEHCDHEGCSCSLAHSSNHTETSSQLNIYHSLSTDTYEATK